MTRGQTASAYTYNGGVSVAENVRKENNIVEEFNLGETQVKICDDYCYNRLDTDIEAILNSIARKAQEHFTAAQ